MDRMTNTTNDSFAILMRENDARARTLIPAMIVFGIYMIVGIIGNSLVCYINGIRFKYSTQNVLIVCLAVFDLLNCLIAIPSDIVDMRFPYAFPSQAACKILRVIMALTSIGSTFTLLVIAVDRYRKICKPLKEQIRKQHVIIAQVLVVLISILYSWPAALIFGFRVSDKTIEGRSIKIWDCSTSDKVKNTMYPLLYTAALFLSFIAISVAMICLYCFILVATKRHCKKMSVKLNVNLRSRKPSSSDDTNFSGSTPLSSTAVQDNSLQHLDETNKSLKLDDLSAPRNMHGFTNDNQGAQVIVEQKTDSLKDGQVHGISGTGHGEQSDMERNDEAKDSHCQSSMHFTHQTGNDVRGNVCFSTNPVADFAYSQKQSPSSCADTTNSFSPMSITNKKQSNLDSFDNTVQERKNSFMETSSKVSGAHEKKASSRRRKEVTTTVTTTIKTKTTIIAFLVTLVFILSFLPYLCLQVAKNALDGYDTHLQGVAYVLYNIFMRSYYINSIANPFIYGIMNIRFRAEVKHVFYCKKAAKK